MRNARIFLALRRLALGSLLGLVAWQAAFASDIHEAAVNVDRQSDEVREDALRHTLGQVLVRVTGDRYITENPQAEPILAMAPRLVQQFRYERGPDGRLQFVARFDPNTVEREVRGQGLPAWARQRPATLAWVAIRDSRGGRRLVGEADATGWLAGLTQTAVERGVPLVIPAMDAADRQAVQFGDIWAGFHEQLTDVSARYSASHNLLGRISQSARGWEGRWTVLENGVEWLSWERSAGSLDALLRNAMHELADRMSERYSLLAFSNAGGAAKIRVYGIHQLADYATVQRYLGSLQAVDSVSVLELSGDSVLYAVQTSGGERHLEQVIDIGRTLRRSARAPAMPQAPQASVGGDGGNAPIGAAGPDDGSGAGEAMTDPHRTTLHYQYVAGR